MAPALVLVTLLLPEGFESWRASMPIPGYCNAVSRCRNEGCCAAGGSSLPNDIILRVLSVSVACSIQPQFQKRILERIKVLGPPWHPFPLTQPRPQPQPQPQPRSQQLPPIRITHRHHHGFESRQSSSSLQPSSSIHCILPLYSLASAVANPFAHLPKAHGLIMCRSSTLFSTWLIIAFCWTSRSSAKQGS